MLSDVPNLALSFGYTNASWTLKCDLTSRYVCRLLRHMDRKGWAICVPRHRRSGAGARADARFQLGLRPPRRRRACRAREQKAPWRVHQNYLKDLAALRFGPVADAAMHFARAGAAQDG